MLAAFAEGRHVGRVKERQGPSGRQTSIGFDFFGEPNGGFVGCTMSCV